MKHSDFQRLETFLGYAPGSVSEYAPSYDQIEWLIGRSLTKYAKQNTHFWTRRAGNFRHVYAYAEAWYSIGWDARSVPDQQLVIFTR